MNDYSNFGSLQLNLDHELQKIKDNMIKPYKDELRISNAIISYLIEQLGGQVEIPGAVLRGCPVNLVTAYHCDTDTLDMEIT